MGFWENLLNMALEKGAQAYSEASAKASQNAAQYSKKYAEQQRKINEYEAKYGKTQKSIEAQKRLQEKCERLNRITGNNTDTSSDEIRIGGRTFEQWDRMWIPLGFLKDANLTPYNHSVGLYRHKVGGKIMYIGRAIELNNGGFRKRLSDYRRESDSARKHQSGKKINQYLNDIWTDVLVVGNDANAVTITKKLEEKFISVYQPEWNVCFK